MEKDSRTWDRTRDPNGFFLLANKMDGPVTSVHKPGSVNQKSLW